MRVWSLGQRDIERSHRTLQDETCAGYVGLRRREESADDELIRVPCGRRARSGQVDVQTVAVVHESVVVRVDEPKGAVPGDAGRQGTHFVDDRKLRVCPERAKILQSTEIDPALERIDGGAGGKDRVRSLERPGLAQRGRERAGSVSGSVRGDYLVVDGAGRRAPVVDEEEPSGIEAPGIQDRADRPQRQRERTLKFRSGNRRVSVDCVSLEVEGCLEPGADLVLRRRVADDARHARTAGAAIESEIHLGPIARVLSFDARDRPHDGDGTSRTPVVEAVDLREGSRPDEHLPDQESGPDDNRRNRDHQDDPTLPPRHPFWLRRLHPVRQELSPAKPLLVLFRRPGRYSQITITAWERPCKLDVACTFSQSAGERICTSGTTRPNGDIQR